MLGLPPMDVGSAPLLTGLLKEVSRSFYLTLRILPAAVRPQIGMAYLLARATDTVADTELVAVSRRLEALQTLRQRILGHIKSPINLRSQLVPAASPSAPAGHVGQASTAESILLDRVEEVLAAVDQFDPEDQQAIREVLAIITSGQSLDLQRFGHADPNHLVALPTAADLHDYTYRVAGCVGEFWTRICRRHLFPHANLNVATLLLQGKRFGQGLQLVNILRDLPRDLRQGRCYLPESELAELDLSPASLLMAANESRLRPLYTQWLNQAQNHLTAGWQYTCSLPASCRRIRLACAWPLLIGLKTLARLRQETILDPTRRIKITRGTVWIIILKSLALLPWKTAWQNQFARTAASMAAPPSSSE